MARKKRAYLPFLLVLVVAVGAAMLARNHSKLGVDIPGASGGGASTAPSAPAAKQSLAQLKKLRVADPLPMAGYSREKFPHWIDQSGGCDTREVVLKRDGKQVKESKGCHPTSGHWNSQYDNKVISDPGDLDIDHVVPLANAWRSGAKNWTTDKRKQFANDLKDPQLVAVSAKSNRSKGDQDPSTWKPPYEGDWCTYARSWISVKSRWELTVTAKERTALTDMLGHCKG